jgi:hypothetical protein
MGIGAGTLHPACPDELRTGYAKKAFRPSRLYERTKSREDVMPLLRFDLIEGRTDEEMKTLLDASHRAMLAAFKVPERDRYQIVHEHPASRMIVEDTGLGIPRTNKVVVVSVTSRPRKKKQKEAFYRLLCEELECSCGIAPSDVMVSIVENTDEDWSFGLGRAQFLSGEL